MQHMRLGKNVELAMERVIPLDEKKIEQKYGKLGKSKQRMVHALNHFINIFKTGKFSTSSQICTVLTNKVVKLSHKLANIKEPNCNILKEFDEAFGAIGRVVDALKKDNSPLATSELGLLEANVNFMIKLTAKKLEASERKENLIPNENFITVKTKVKIKKSNLNNSKKPKEDTKSKHFENEKKTTTSEQELEKKIAAGSTTARLELKTHLLKTQNLIETFNRLVINNNNLLLPELNSTLKIDSDHYLITIEYKSITLKTQKNMTIDEKNKLNNILVAIKKEVISISNKDVRDLDCA